MQNPNSEQPNIQQKPVKKKQKKILSTIMLFGILCIPLIYLVVNLYSTYYRPYTTQTAVEVTLSDIIPSTGIICREETVLESSEGVPVYSVTDGLRISAGSQVAETYGGLVPALSKDKIDKLTLQIAALEYAQNAGVVAGTDVDTVMRDLNDNYLKLLGCITSGTYYEYWDSTHGFTTALNRLQIATGQTTQYDELIATLSAEKDNLVANNVPNQIINAPVSGFFISTTDGLEQTLTPDSVKGFTPTNILNAKATTPQTLQSSVGKIITDYKWYYICAVEKEKAQRFIDATPETKVEIKFSNTTAQPVPAFIEQVVDEGGDYIKVVLRCEVMRPDIASLRFEAADISFRTITGIRIDKKAMQIVDGEMGVFIKYGHLVSFKRITPIFENDEYFLVPLNPNPEKTGVNEIKLFDEVITQGKDLHDGKLL